MYLNRIEIKCGPGWIAYDIEEGTLKVWIGEYEEDAPLKANRAQILEGYDTWIMKEDE